MKMAMFIIVGLLFSITSGALGQDSLTSYGNFLGSSFGKPSKEELEQKAQETKRIAEEKRKAEQEADAKYKIKQQMQAPAMTNRVMQFRLQQATNGNYMYQCKVATNYMKGTDGFLTNRVLAQYWVHQALLNTNK
jgi:hypothetical protein